MLGAGLTGGALANPEKMATANASARAVANFSGRGVMRSNFAADQFDLLRPRIGFRDWPQYKLVETLRNIFTEACDDVVGGAINRAFEISLGATAHRGEHRAHFLERALARRRDAAEQDQSRFAVPVGASVAGRIVTNLRHARAEFIGSLERREEPVGQSRRAFQRRVGAA